MPVNTLVPGLQRVSGLNDNGMISGIRTNQQSLAEVFLYDVDANDLVLLPYLPGEHLPYAYLPFVDNSNRVVAAVATSASGLAGNVGEIYWIEAGGAPWIAASIDSDLYPSVSKSGRILFTGHTPSASFTGYLDLNHPDDGVTYIPSSFVPPWTTWPDTFYLLPYDANAAGQIVGGTLGDAVGWIYQLDTTEAYAVQPYLDDGWHADAAVCINASGVVAGTGVKNYGTPAFQMRGWIEDFGQPKPTWTGSLPSLVVEILFGVIGGGGGFGFTRKKGVHIPGNPPLSSAKVDLLTVLSMSPLGSLVRDPELRQLAERLGNDLLEEAVKNAVGKRRR